MREIMFRGKRLDNGRWVRGLPFAVHSGLKIEGIETWDGERHLVDTKTVGQYTGMVDKNGTKIFEGDVVRTKYGRLCVVVWFSSNGCIGWDLMPVDTVENCVHTKAPDAYDVFKKDNLEVIGNIHDNPEFEVRNEV